MRRSFQLLVALGLLAIGLNGTGAFTRAAGARDIGVTIAGDQSAYVSVVANPSSPHKCFVSTSNGRTLIDVGAITGTCAANGGGTGISPGDGGSATRRSRYAFHDLLLVKNNGPEPLVFWINATTTSAGSSKVDVALKTTTGAMTNADYRASSATSWRILSTDPGLYVGVRVDSGSLGEGLRVFGNITIETRTG
jgi:hypothetical protein